MKVDNRRLHKKLAFLRFFYLRSRWLLQKRKIWFLSGLVFLGSITSHAQQEVMFTQYMFNGLVLNPAYAGSHESISMTALSRIQWVGIDGAPNTHTFSVHSPIPGKNAGLGVFFSRDNIGVTSRNNLFLSYAYRIKTGSGTLALGLQGGISNTRVSYDDLGVQDVNLSGTENTFHPNFGTGIYYNTQTFYFGASIPYLISNGEENRGNTLPSDIDMKQVRHYYFTSGLVFDVAPLIKLKPSILVKAVPGAPVEFDLNANLLLDETLWLGVSYRSFDSINFLIEFQLNDQLRLGYAYDATVTELRRVNTGSHEIMLNYRLNFSPEGIVTPRYF